MYYFDQITLQQYLSQKKGDLKVYVDQGWYQVADMADLEDTISGIGYDGNGSPHRFDYTDIEIVKYGRFQMSIDQLQTQKTGEAPEEKDTPSKDSGEDVPPEEEKPEKGKEPDLSWFSPYYDIGRNLLKEARRKNGK